MNKLFNIKYVPKYSYQLFFYFLLIITVLGCSKSSTNQGELLYWSSNNTHEIEFAQYITEEWNKVNHLKKIKFQPVPEGQSSEEVILAAVVGKTTPDIYSNMWQGDVELYAQAGVLIPLDTLDGFLQFLYERCDSNTVEEVKSNDGHIYQIPWKANPIMMIYNKNLIGHLPIDGPPKTYSEYTNAAKLFQKDVDGDGYVDRWFGNAEAIVTWWQRFFDFYPLYLAASGGAPLIKNGKAYFNNKYAVGVFAFLKELYDNNYFSRERLSTRQDVFLASVIATRFVGPWEIAHAEKYKTEGFEYEFRHMPVPATHKGPVYTYGDPKNIVIFNTCEKPQEAFNFLRFALNKENDLKFLELTAQLPRRKNLLGDPAFEEFFVNNPKMVVFAKQLEHIRGTDAHPALKEVFDLISQQYEACVIYGTKEPEEAIAEAEEAVNLLLMK